MQYIFILNTIELWNPTDLANNESPIKYKIKYNKANFNQSLKQLLSLGLTSNELIELINQNAIIDS